MARTRAKTKEPEKVYFSIKGMRVKNVRELSDNVVAFSLLGKGLSLYNMRVVYRKDGESAFVCAPQTKAKNGEYYNQYAVYLSVEDQAAIIDMVEEALDEK